MKLSNIFISILIATNIAAGVTAYQINNTNEEHKKGFLALSELNLQLVEELKSLKIDLSIYQQELQNSKAISASLNEKLLGLQRTSDLPEEMPVKITQQKQVEPEQSFEKEPEMDALLAFAKRIKNGESIANIEDNFREQFYEEEVDGNWAYEYETNIRDLVAADENNNFNIQKKDRTILWNHRLQKQKNPWVLFKLQDFVKRKISVCAPEALSIKALTSSSLIVTVVPLIPSSK